MITWEVIGVVAGIAFGALSIVLTIIGATVAVSHKISTALVHNEQLYQKVDQGISDIAEIKTEIADLRTVVSGSQNKTDVIWEFVVRRAMGRAVDRGFVESETITDCEEQSQ